MALIIKARKTRRYKDGDDTYDVHNNYYQLSDDRYVTRQLAAEMVKNGELNGYHIYEKDNVEFLRDNPDKEESDNINRQPIIPWPCDTLFTEDTSASLLINEDGSGIIWSHEFGEFLLSHDYLTQFLREGGSSKIGLPISEQRESSHNSAIHFQAFEKGIIFTNDEGEIEVFAGSLLRNYVNASYYSRTRPNDPQLEDALAAEQGLGLPTAQMHPTPHGSIRVMGNGAMYFPACDTPVFYANDHYPMIDGRVVRNTDSDVAIMLTAVLNDPYLADYRRQVALQALTWARGTPCGDTARDRIGTISTKYCSEFVRQVYRRSCMDVRWLRYVTYAEQLRRIFKNNSEFVWAESITPQTAEPGDYLYMNGGDHSALAIATSLDRQHMWKVGGNEGDDDCILHTIITYFNTADDDQPVLNSDISGIGRLSNGMF